ncbi:MAG: HAD family hydrolase [Candidatus Paceibacterota bacterium]|jgi:3-deoxy-D-manno-octulosonate 8-phosphate phosphatase KdsC-like HAD superfamily phosphatase
METKLAIFDFSGTLAYGKISGQKLLEDMSNLSFELFGDAQKAFALPVQKAILTAADHFLLKGCDIPKDIKIFTPLETKYLKPDPRAFLFVLEQLGVSPQQAAMIGDEVERDLIPAVGLGMKAFLINRENKDISVLPNGIIRINSLKKLGEYIR